jgi:hypothetical protein
VIQQVTPDKHPLETVPRAGPRWTGGAHRHRKAAARRAEASFLWSPTAEPVKLPAPPSPRPPDFHRVRAESNTEVVSPTSSGGSRPATSYDIAIEFLSEPKSSKRVREGTDRMPKSGTMPNNRVPLGELSESSRI